MKPSRAWLLVILLVAAVARFAAVPLAHNLGLISDEREYLFLATRWQHGESFIDTNGDASMRYPLFPALLSLVPGLSADNLAIPFAVECLLGVLAVYLVYRLGFVIWENQQAALVAAGAAALHPGLVVYSALLLTEAPFVAMFLTILLFMRRLLDNPEVKEALLIGILAGLAILTRAMFLAPFCLLIAFYWWRLRANDQTLHRSLVFGFIPVAICALVLAPWTIRNYDLHHALVPVSTLSGLSMVYGNNPYMHGSSNFDPGFSEWFAGQRRERGVTDPDSVSEYELMKVDQRIALDYIRAHPWDTMKHMVQKAYVFWIYPLSHQQPNTRLKLLMIAADVLLYLGGAIGIGVAWHFRRRLSLLWVPMLGFLTVHLVLHAEARYRIPLVPLLCILFGGVVVAWRDRTAFTADRPGLRMSLTIIGAVVGIYAVTALLYLYGLI